MPSDHGPRKVAVPDAGAVSELSADCPFWELFTADAHEVTVRLCPDPPAYGGAKGNAPLMVQARTRRERDDDLPSPPIDADLDMRGNRLRETV